MITTTSMLLAASVNFYAAFEVPGQPYMHGVRVSFPSMPLCLEFEEAVTAKAKQGVYAPLVLVESSCEEQEEFQKEEDL